MLYDSYRKIDSIDKAERIKDYLGSIDPAMKENLDEYAAIESADFCMLEMLQCENSDLFCFLETYERSAKSIRKAQVYNALLPGAGYYYVGQKKTAVTAVIVNALFTYAAYQFFHHGNTAAGMITASLEMGWYLGGINGAGLAAREINEGIFRDQGKEFLVQHRLFPLLMFEHAF